MHSAQETMARIEAHGLRSRTEAGICRDKATQARTDAAAYAAQHHGDAMASRREHILADGEAKAREHEAEARRHDDRARTAEKGYLLHTEEDMRDPHYAMSNQELLAAAGHHGLLRSEPV